MCDGVVDCNDNSDETSELCLQKECPSGSFKCSYGACVAGDSECNGTTECADLSDEFSPRCRQPGAGRPQTMQCENNQFQCQNKECLASYMACDGKADCSDKSDETRQRCSNITCPPYSFQCDYGGCILRRLVCDNKFDCVDGSDEKRCQSTTSAPQWNFDETNNGPNNNHGSPNSNTNRPNNGWNSDSNENIRPTSRPNNHQTSRPNISGRPTASWNSSERPGLSVLTFDMFIDENIDVSSFRPTNQQRLTTRPTSNSNSNNQPNSWNSNSHNNVNQNNRSTPRPNFSNTNRPTRPLVSQGLSVCRVNVPENGKAKFINGEEAYYGDNVENYQSIKYECIRDHHIEGESTALCINGAWNNETPKCVAKCSPNQIQGTTIVANCFKRENGASVSFDCRQLADPGTYATISCKSGYERTKNFTQSTICGDDGRWSPRAVRCQEICGKEGNQGIPYIVGGQNINIAKVPWHAGIYRKTQGNNYLYQCGGTIISARLILSAMHCFWDKQRNRKNSEDDFMIAVGKTNRDLFAEEDLKKQVFRIEKIHNHETYRDLEGLYTGDITIILLKQNIDFTNYIAPACMYFNFDYTRLTVLPGLTGKVAGWGKTESGGVASDVLKSIEMPVVSDEECIRTSSEEFKKFLTSDKFCAGFYEMSIGVCEGDSGGGLVLKDTDDRYYVRGIVSLGSEKQGSCDVDKYTTFTNVQKHMELISPLYNQYQPSL